jgi:Mlc titration factor MtfA (ptsG expression regulator)
MESILGQAIGYSIFLVLSFALHWLFKKAKSAALVFFNGPDFLPKMHHASRNQLRISDHFYQGLSLKEKALYEGRIEKFLRKKKFHARGGIEITPEMQLTVAAKAVQLTLGFPSVYLDHFDRFFIYPEAYRSRMTGLRHQGEVHPMGVVVLSWADAQRGNAQPEDGTNLILHELAHALLLENERQSAKNDFLDPEALKTLNLCRVALQGRVPGPFYTDRHLNSFHEFFAKSVELFFEHPEALKEMDVRLIDVMRKILRQ